MSEPACDAMRPSASTAGDPSLKSILFTVAGLVLLTVALRAPLLNLPFERDEGEYAYVAWRMEHNELPYRDWIDRKPPGIFWVYWLGLSLPLEPVRAAHLMGLLFSAGSAVALFFLASRFMSRFGAGTAAALFALLSADPMAQGIAANTELFMLLPLILSQIVFLSATTNDRHRTPLIVLVGVLTGIAAIFKQVAIVNWPLLVFLYPAVATGEKRLRGMVRFALWSAGGAGLVWALVAIYFWGRHALGDFVYGIFTHNLGYVSAIHWSMRWNLFKQSLDALAPSQALAWIFSLAGFAGLWMARRTKWFLFLAGGAVASMAGVSASGYFYRHYFLQLLPVLCLAAAAGAEALEGAPGWERVPRKARRAATGIALAILPVAAILPFLFCYTPAEAARKIYPGDAFAEMPALGRRIAEVTHPEDRVFIFGEEAEVLFYARRASATRYIFLSPLYGLDRNARERQTAAAGEITRARPAAALYMPNMLFFQPGSEQYFTRWSQTYLQDNFRADTCLTLDPAGALHLVSSVGDQKLVVPNDQRVGAVILVRNDH
ncbi:MAG: glycosyltransferase family 39 protein [Verrucomicrobiota bacterium]|jgi:hypothetical protein